MVPGGVIKNTGPLLRVLDILQLVHRFFGAGVHPARVGVGAELRFAAASQLARGAGSRGMVCVKHAVKGRTMGWRGYLRGLRTVREME